MRVIAWNCNMAFRKKAEHILAFKPDILVVSECEHPDKMDLPSTLPAISDVFWFGKNVHKGLGVFSFSDYKFKLHKPHNSKLRTILPLHVSNSKHAFNLFAIWANNTDDPDGHYVTQIWKAIHYYNKLLKSGMPTLLAGDFNSNTIFDKPKREGNHSTVVKKLEGWNIRSVYHLHHKQQHGKEKHPTWYLYRHRNKPYHLDYCFASSDFADKVSDVQIGKHKDWARFSDHTPVIVTFDV